MVAGLALILAAPLVYAEKEEGAIKLSETPEAVQKTVQTLKSLLADGLEVEHAHKEMHGETTVYEVEIEHPDGSEGIVEIDADGRIVEIEGEEHED